MSYKPQRLTLIKIFYLITLSTLLGVNVFAGLDVSGHTNVKHHVGRTFVLKEALYLYDYKGISVSGPLINGPVDVTKKYGSPRLPFPVSESKIGLKNGPIEILGVIGKGEEVSIVKILYTKSFSWESVEIMMKTDSAIYPKVIYMIPVYGGIKQISEMDFGEKFSFFRHYLDEIEAK